jgi:MFS-type transporter involved in bile tolerance (Atg22 family)
MTYDKISNAPRIFLGFIIIGAVVDAFIPILFQGISVDIQSATSNGFGYLGNILGIFLSIVIVGIILTKLKEMI